MAPRLYTLRSGQVDPYANLAREECLLDAVGEGELILYLWQNERTVVIGRNQNAYDECDLAALEADGGHLARRLSGGGAVYHDLGNLNFTFVMPAEAWDLDRQTEVLLRAVGSLGIAVERSGRNDLTVEGRKFSGHAYYHRGDASYHHGTLMLDVDGEPLARYLNVSPLKLGSKGVSSVRSRVSNLVEFAPGLTVERLAEAVEAAFAEVYGGAAEPFAEERLSSEALAAAEERLRSREWLLRDAAPLDRSATARFSWGTVRFDWSCEEGRIARAALYTDGLDADLLERVPAELQGITASPEGVEGRLLCIGAGSDMAYDIASLLDV